MSELQNIAQSVSALASPGMTPKDLFAAVRKAHPKASKKDISRAAFFAMILASEADPAKAAQAHELALGSRAATDEAEAVELPARRRRTKRP